MHDSRESFWKIILNNFINLFNIAVIGALVYLVINKEYLYIAPLCISVLTTLFKMVVDIKRFVLQRQKNQNINVLINNQETESTLFKLKKGDKVVLYPNDVVNFVGVIQSGTVYVDESKITGSSALVEKTPGTSIRCGTIVVEGTAVIEMVGKSNKSSRKGDVTLTSFSKQLRVANFLISLVAFTLLLMQIVLFKDESLNPFFKVGVGALPCLVNSVVTIYLFAKSQKIKKEGIRLLDETVLTELEKVDVVCLDKSGTITTGEYEIFKTVVIAPSAFTGVGSEINKGFNQLVSNILRATKETGGYYASLQERFDYDSTRVATIASPITKNGHYSAITIKGGTTYALGKPENFELSNKRSVENLIQEYRHLGYRVLLLVESKSPLKNGSIEGKSQGIGLIVLQEKIRESTKELIQYCLQNNKIIKIMSGDDLSSLNDVCRKIGFDETDKSVSLTGVTTEALDYILLETTVFANASSKQKAHIVSELQKRGHTVAYIGDGDNDTKALKVANVGVAVEGATLSAVKSSQVVVKEPFDLFNKLADIGEKTHRKLTNVLSILFSQVIFIFLSMIVFLSARNRYPELVNPFEYNHLFMWIIFGGILPAIFVLCASNKEKAPKTSLMRLLTMDSLLYIIPVLAIYIAQLLQYFGHGYFYIPTDTNELHEKLITSQVANNLSYLVLILTSLFVTYNHLQPMNKGKVIMFVITALVPVSYFVLLGFGFDFLSDIAQINTSILTYANYFAALIVGFVGGSLYLFVLSIIATIKGENINA